MRHRDTFIIKPETQNITGKGRSDGTLEIYRLLAIHQTLKLITGATYGICVYINVYL